MQDKSPSYQELLRRVEALEARFTQEGDVDLDALDFSKISRKLEQVWTPDSNWIQSVGQAASGGVTPYCHAFLASNNAGGAPFLTSGSYLAIPLTAEVIDNDNMHDNVTNNTRVTCRTPGVYVCQAQMIWGNNPNGTRRVVISKNAGASPSTGQLISQRAETTGVGTYVPMTIVTNLVAGDYLELLTYQDSGSTLTAIGDPGDGADACSLKTAWIGSL